MSFHHFDLTRMRVMSSYHFHTQRILDRANQISAIAPTDLTKFDNYVRSMYDIWVSYYDLHLILFGTGDSTFRRINLANPDWALADFIGGLTIDNAGIKGNGTNAYINTNFNPSLLVSGQKYQLNDASRGACIVDPATGTAPFIIDGVAGQIHNSMISQNSSANYINNNSTPLSSTVDNTGSGLKIICRTTSTEVRMINKNIENVRTSNSILIFNSSQLIFRRNNNYSNAKISSYSIGKSIPFDISQTIRTNENAALGALGLPQIA